MRNIKTIYLTLLHVIALGSVWLYTNDNYTLVKMTQPVAAKSSPSDEMTAWLDKEAAKLPVKHRKGE